MEWTDDGIVLGARRHGEANAILEVMTQAHGRHLGLVRGGAGTRMRPVLQPGNTVRATWRARLDEHLGHFTVEGLRLRAADLLAAAHALYGVTHLAALCRLLPERDPHRLVHADLAALLDRMDDPIAVAVAVVRFDEAPGELIRPAPIGIRGGAETVADRVAEHDHGAVRSAAAGHLDIAEQVEAVERAGGAGAARHRRVVAGVD